MPPRKRQPASPALLEIYQQKRNFANSPEPPAEISKGSGKSFVVQEHHARSHHFDFRLEMNGVLVSWAVPKGLPDDLAAKRLAVHVEDHPLDYGNFEGEIPKGSYGAGSVRIWDKGEWLPLEKNWRKEFEKGKLKFILKGGRLHGIYLLVRMNDEPNWLMRKLDEENSQDAMEAPNREYAHFIAPQLARVVPSVPEGNQWVHEIKFDGYRLIAVQRKGKLTLHTRSKLDWTDRFSSLAERIAKLTPKDFVIDGEAVVFDQKGRTRFEDLQVALKSGGGENIQFVAFDLLHFDGLNLRELPLEQRLKRLTSIVPPDADGVHLSKLWQAHEGKDLFKQACRNGLEGIISKSARGRYIEGSRRDWAKSKCRACQEFVICGYTSPKGSLPAFGALVMGSFEDGQWVSRGKVGTGFTDKTRRLLLEKLQKILTQKVPFTNPEKGIHWVEPVYVAKVEFAELTSDGAIRQGSFIALRDDKLPKEVHLDAILTAKANAKDLKVAGITISHANRMVYPADQVTKMEVACYIERVGPWMLPFIVHRPLSVLRAPEGISGDVFFQKSFKTHLPPHVYQEKLKDGTTVFSVRDVRGLVALAQYGVIEIHLWGSVLPKVDKPDLLTWDLDPDSSVSWKEVLGAALLTRDVLADLGLSSVVKTSGGKGLHVLMRLRRTHGWETIRTFTKAVAAAVAEHHPQKFVITPTKAKRTGRIFIDWMRNGRGSTCVAPWSLRARPGAPVSMPLNWRDLHQLPPEGYRIHHCTLVPEEWENLPAQSLSGKVLKCLGVNN